MSDSLVGKKVLIHCYKHDGSIHRCWANDKDGNMVG